MYFKWLFGFGFFFLALGVLGFFPALAHNSLLFGMFPVNDIQNTLHLAIALLCFIAVTRTPPRT